MDFKICQIQPDSQLFIRVHPGPNEIQKTTGHFAFG